MATQGNWNIGGVNLPDFGITESLGIGTPNSLINNPGTGLDYSQIPQGFKNDVSNYLNTPISVPTSTSGNTTYYGANPALQTAKNAVVSSPVGQTPTQQQNSQDAVNSGFDMKYYPGWNYTEALADWKATGGAKGRKNTNTNTKYTSTKNDQRVNNVLGNPDTLKDFEQSGLNMDEYLAAIDKESGNTMGFLQQQEDALRSDQPGIEKNILAQAELLKNKAASTKEDAQSAARRLYSELQQGYRQRFGGASSAGEAAMALTGNEQQRQMAQNNRTYQEAVSQVDMSANQATQAAQSEFRNQLLAINQNRVATENERLAARRQALSDLSNKVFQIQQQREAFKQNLAAMQEQARLQNQANLSSLSLNPTTTLTTTQQPTTASGNQGLETSIGYKNPVGTFNNTNDLWNRLGVGIPGVNY